MSYGMEYPLSAAQAPASERAGFIRRTYGHLAGAILVFVAMEWVLLHLPLTEQMIGTVESTPMMWLIVMVLFTGVNYIAQWWANSTTSVGMQYAGLGLTAAAWAIIFTFLLYPATHSARYNGVIPQAAIMTLAVFGGLTAAVLVTGKDFSFLGPIIAVASLLSIGVIVAGILFGFNLGLFFCFAMVALASASILYNTSNVLHRYNTDQHVAAALALFGSIAILFWYILQIFMSSRD